MTEHFLNRPGKQRAGAASDVLLGSVTSALDTGTAFPHNLKTETTYWRPHLPAPHQGLTHQHRTGRRLMHCRGQHEPLIRKRRACDLTAPVSPGRAGTRAGRRRGLVSSGSHSNLGDFRQREYRCSIRRCDWTPVKQRDPHNWLVSLRPLRLARPPGGSTIADRLGLTETRKGRAVVTLGGSSNGLTGYTPPHFLLASSATRTKEPATAWTRRGLRHHHINKPRFHRIHTG